jgi:chromosome segregation protein
MDDTIFKGTQHRKPLNMTEVVLSFDNCNGTSALPYEEVTITRKLFRSGESEYLINNTECRLKDVTDLILDMGIGNDAYSLIEQRMIDAILNGKSGERRRILEEAAGIVKYKDRKKQSLRQLDRTTHDLEHIQVLVEEVERTVRGLKRHVGKAKRYKAYREREREIETTLTQREYTELTAKEGTVKTQLEALEDERRKRIADIQALEVNIREGKVNVASWEDNLNTMRVDLRNRTIDVKTMDERLAVLQERTIHRRERKERVEVETGETVGVREALEKELGELENERNENSTRLTEVSDRLTALQSERMEVEGELEAETQKYKMGEEDRLKAVETVAEIKARLNALEIESVSLQERREQLERQIETKRTVMNEKSGERDGFLGEIAELKAIVDKMSGRLEKLSRLKERIVTRRESSDDDMREQQLQLNNIVAQLEMQKKWSEDFEGYPPGVASVLRERDNLPGIIGPVGDLFDIDDQFSRAIERGLGAHVKMIVTEDNLSALKAIEYLRSEGKGIAPFLSLEMIQSLNGIKLVKPPSWIIATGVDVVACDSSIQPLRDLLLGDLWIVPPPLTREDLDEYFQAPARVVSIDGCLLVDNMVLWGGEDGGASDLLLQRSKRLEELENEAVSLNRSLDKVESDYRKLNQILKGADEEYNKLQRRSSREIETLKEREVGLLALDREKTSLQGEIRQLEEELNGIQALRGSREEELGELRESLAEMGIGQEVDSEQAPGNVLDHIRERKIAVDRGIEEMKVERATLRSLISENEKRVGVVNRELNSRSDMLKRLEDERSNLDDELAKFEGETVQIGEEKRVLAECVSKLEGDLSRNEEEIRASRMELEQKETILEKLRRDSEATISQIQRLGLEKNDLNNKIFSLKDRIGEKYGINLSELPTIEGNEDHQSSDLRAELRELRVKIANLGHVNFVALEEYEREEERCTVLKAQRDDLVNAKESLEITIRKINRTARERFMETFGQVRGNFQETFRVLFRGGKADLIMDDGADPLEAEIDMVAQPFGKRLESVDLLSGGERALTALALLFAIYLVKPSPFCILDEADAALDDANVDRLLDMLVQFRGSTQFIIITHNKKTMSAANCLYGVTMEEPGISKVVSVALDGGNLRRTGGDGKGMVSKEEKAGV